MPKLLAIEWDAREARIAVAQRRGREILLEDAFSVELPEAAGEGTAADEVIAAAVASRSLAKSETLVAVGRSNIELRQLTLPPAPDDELPELVRFQALRQFTAISPDWPLDYVPLQSDEESATVLAAAISPEIVKQINTTCQTGDLTPKRLVLRPFAAASLLCRRERDGMQPARLMIDILADEADLTVLDGTQVVLMRTIRLPRHAGSEDEASSVPVKAMLGETRRTIAAAQNQLQGKRIEKIVLCGDGRDQMELKQHLEEELSYTVEFINPFDQVQLHRKLKQQAPEHSGRFTPLIGMLVDEAAGAAHALDFLHPRKKPEPPSQLRRNSLIAATAACLVLALGFLLWFQLSTADATIEQLTQKSNSLKEATELAQGHRDDLALIREFMENDFVWLDELRDLCAELPSAETVRLNRISLRTRVQGNGGEIEIQGHTRESSQIREVEQALRIRDRQVRSEANQQDPSQQSEYTWRFKHTGLVLSHTDISSDARLADASAAPEPADSTAGDGSSDSTQLETSQPAPTEVE